MALLALLVTSACTDGRKLHIGAPTVLNTFSAPATLTAASEIRFNGEDTETMQMVVQGTSLYLTGRPFAFSRWEVSPDPENPSITFAASERLASQSNPFAPMGRWDVNAYASGALTLLGNYAFMSGTAGTSAVSLASLNFPVERARYPAIPVGSTSIVTDEAFKYKALLAHPSLPILYGFREQDFVYTLNIGASGLTLANRASYTDGGTVCCVRGGTVFANRAYIAFRDRLAFYDFDASGALTNPGEFRALQVSLIASTPRFLYLFHDPIYNQGAVSAPKGLYVFDADGNHVGYFSMNAPLRFAVNPNDTHLYVNVDNTSIQVLRMNWPAQ